MATRNELMIGGILGLILGGLITFNLAHQRPARADDAATEALEPLGATGVGTDLGPHESADPDAASRATAVRTTVRPVRPGSLRLAEHDGPVRS